MFLLGQCDRCRSRTHAANAGPEQRSQIRAFAHRFRFHGLDELPLVEHAVLHGKPHADHGIDHPRLPRFDQRDIGERQCCHFARVSLFHDPGRFEQPLLFVFRHIVSLIGGTRRLGQNHSARASSSNHVHRFGGGQLRENRNAVFGFAGFGNARSPDAHADMGCLLFDHLAVIGENFHARIEARAFRVRFVVGRRRGEDAREVFHVAFGPRRFLGKRRMVHVYVSSGLENFGAVALQHFGRVERARTFAGSDQFDFVIGLRFAQHDRFQARRGFD